jgi:hypothetical protein
MVMADFTPWLTRLSEIAVLSLVTPEVPIDERMASQRGWKMRYAPLPCKTVRFLQVARTATADQRLGV